MKSHWAIPRIQRRVKVGCYEGDGSDEEAGCVGKKECGCRAVENLHCSVEEEEFCAQAFCACQGTSSLIVVVIAQRQGQDHTLNRRVHAAPTQKYPPCLDLHLLATECTSILAGTRQPQVAFAAH